jgi:hypothetical protein
MASRQQYFAIKNSLTRLEKELISFYELQWFLRNRVPTIEEVALQLKIKQTEVNYYLTRKPVKKALSDRGIKWEQHSQENLTATQVAAAVVMMNFTDTRDNATKLDELGISPDQYYAWQSDPQFKILLDNLADRNLKGIRPTAIAEFTKLVNKGDWHAIKYFLDVSGEFRSNEAPQSEVLLKMIIEIIQDEIKDPEVILRIAERIKLASANRTLEIVASPTSHFEGQVVSSEDPELEHAKKMIGF